MQQLEIEFFWPLTQQTELDLDFTPSEQWIAEWRKRQWNTTAYSGSILVSNGGTGAITGTSWNGPPMSTFVVKPNEKTVGKWQITEGMFVYRPTKPNAVIRFMAKYLLGFKWHDEI
jgi:hypothetical protein